MKLQIHHIDGDPLNNDPANLRRVRVSTNPPITPPRPRGRPPAAPDRALTASIHERLTPAQKAKYKRLGAGEWLRRAIDRTKEPACS